LKEYTQICSKYPEHPDHTTDLGKHLLGKEDDGRIGSHIGWLLEDYFWEGALLKLGRFDFLEDGLHLCPSSAHVLSRCIFLPVQGMHKCVTPVFSKNKCCE
jgi:hypothetical protein